jgi:hypothetical protein
MIRQRSDPKLRVESDKLLIVEGIDDKNIVEACLKWWSIEGFQVMQVGGKTNLKDGLESTLAGARVEHVDISAIGIMRDADDNASGAFDSVNRVLGQFELPAPLYSGSIILGPPRVGVYIFPDCKAEGAIEQLCWRAVKDTDAGKCASGYVQCLETAGAFEAKDRDKSLANAYISSKENPWVPIGIAALQNYWPFDHPAFSDVKRFLTELAK